MANQQTKMTIKNSKEQWVKYGTENKSERWNLGVFGQKSCFVNGELALGEQQGRKDEPEILIFV